MARSMLRLLILALAVSPQASSSLFQTENASTGQFSFRDGVLEMHRGPGWLRTPRWYSDFRLSLDFRSAQQDAGADLVLRGIVSEGRLLEPAYRIALPQLLNSTPETALVGPVNTVKVVRAGRIDARPAEEWHRLEITAMRRTVTITIDGKHVGDYDIERLAGYLLLNPRKGSVQMRNVAVSIIEPAFTPPVGTLTFAEVTKAGGRPPKVLKERKPSYTIETLHQRKVQGNVMLEAIVLPDGAVGDVRVTRSLDPDLDQSAVAAVREWSFSPGMVNNVAVPVLVEVELTFTIRPPGR